MKVAWPRRVRAGRRPHVEVVVPCHNYGRYLPECVASIVSQPGVHATVTIVDDASTDDSAVVAGRLAEENPGVRLVENPENLGAVRTFNRGLAEADSDYVVLLSADDLLAPGSLQRSAALLDARPAVGLVYGRAHAFSGAPPQWRARPVTWTTWRGAEWLRLQFRRGWNPISSPEAMVRTQVQHAVGYYDPTLPHTHDLDMWLRIAAVAGVGHVNGVDQAFYRVHGANLSGTFSGGVTRDIEHRVQAYQRFLERAPDAVDVTGLRAILARQASDEVVALAFSALASGRVAPDAVDDARALARRIDPTVEHRRAWRDLAALESAGGSAPPPGARVRARGREVAAGLRWWRWRLVGL